MGDMSKQNYEQARTTYQAGRRKDWAMAIVVLALLMVGVLLILKWMN